MQLVAQRGILPHLLLDAAARVGILFAASDIRYARQTASGDFAIEHLPSTGDAAAAWVYSSLGIDTISGNPWAAWVGQNGVYVATRGAGGWSDPITAIPDGDLIGLGVRDGVVQLIGVGSGLIYASNASGTFAQQVLDTSTNFYWGNATFALLPSGRPIVVIARDTPGNDSGMWLLKGPAV